MKEAQAMTPALEDYLKAIYLLGGEAGAVRLSDVASYLSVSKASAHKAVASLVDKDLVEHVPYGPVSLTDSGVTAAGSLASKYEIIKRYLMRVLDVNESEASYEACLMEHVIGSTTVEKMRAFV